MSPIVHAKLKILSQSLRVQTHLFADRKLVVDQSDGQWKAKKIVDFCHIIHLST